jgi:acyl carrier protein
MYVLDDRLEPVPVGVAGELFIGGVAVGLGYLNRPELTAQRFVRDPFSEVPGARLYRTGDLGRYRPDGTIEFLGRIDHQVKVRGFRIELGEVESALAQCPVVREAVVVAREGAVGSELVAYVVARAGVEPSAGELRRFLGELLPDYMIPSRFVVVDRVPLSPNGKVDRRALPAPSEQRPPGGTYVPARSPVEAQLAGLWSEVLSVERVGIEDNFFELGGHSLMATQLMARIRAAWSVELPLRQLFETPTVSGQATAIEAALLAEIEQLSDDDVHHYATKEP